MRRLPFKVLIVIGLVAFTMLQAAPLVGAATVSLVEGYGTASDGLVPGMGASFVEGSDKSVDYLTTANGPRFAGIVSRVDPSAISVGTSSSRVYLARYGSAEVLVSDLRGDVTEGDQLTISPLNGIFMKAQAGAGETAYGVVTGSAQSDTARQLSVRGENGISKTARVKLVPVTIQVTKLPVASTGAQETSLQRLGRALTNKPVSQLQVVSALVLFILMLMIEGVIIYAAVRNSIIAVGRNPLAKVSVYKQMRQIFGLAIVVLVVSMLAIYGILWV